MVITDLKVVSWKWNQYQTSWTVTRKLGQGCHRASTSVKNRYLALSTQGHRQTMMPQLVRDLAAVSGRRISRQAAQSSCRDWTLCPATSLPAFSRKGWILRSPKHPS
ncbi:hypothetical protein TNCV_2956671 [Trichonephila clavipes]|nr:hypothetical protein TNCV_2956671 [Trichonephila clavipes]